MSRGLQSLRRPPRVLLILAGCGIFLAADLLMGRLWVLLERPALEIHWKLEGEYRVAHSVYHHDLRPRHAGTAIWGPIRYPIHTNSFGFRDASSREVPARTTARRLLIIGDSFTEGPGVEYESTFAGRLSTAYSAEGVEVLNAAVASYAPAMYWKKIEFLLDQRGLTFDAVTVFLDISDIQDEATAYRIDGAGRVVDRSTGPDAPTAPWRRNSLTLQALRVAAGRAPWRVLACTVVLDTAPCHAAWTVSPLAMARFGRDGLRLADAHMTRLAATLRTRGIPMTVVVYPWPHQLLWNDRPSAQSSYWREWSRRERTGFVDLFPSFFSAVDRTGAGGAIRRYFIAGDVHWNAAGHQLVADVIRPRVDELIR